MRNQTTTDITRDRAGLDRLPVSQRRCRAELSNDLIDENGVVIEHLIELAFTTLGAHMLDVRVTSAEGARMLLVVDA